MLFPARAGNLKKTSSLFLEPTAEKFLAVFFQKIAFFIKRDINIFINFNNFFGGLFMVEKWSLVGSFSFQKRGCRERCQNELP